MSLIILTSISFSSQEQKTLWACGKIRNFSRNLPCPARTHATGYPAAGMGASTSKVGLEKSQKIVIFWIFPHPLWEFSEKFNSKCKYLFTHLLNNVDFLVMSIYNSLMFRNKGRIKDVNHNDTGCNPKRN